VPRRPAAAGASEGGSAGSPCGVAVADRRWRESTGQSFQSLMAVWGFGDFCSGRRRVNPRVKRKKTASDDDFRTGSP
jgi:hypothetical protein